MGVSGPLCEGPQVDLLPFLEAQGRSALDSRLQGTALANRELLRPLALRPRRHDRPRLSNRQASRIPQDTASIRVQRTCAVGQGRRCDLWQKSHWRFVCPVLSPSKWIHTRRLPRMVPSGTLSDPGPATQSLSGHAGKEMSSISSSVTCQDPVRSHEQQSHHPLCERSTTNSATLARQGVEPAYQIPTRSMGASWHPQCTPRRDSLRN